MHAIDSESYYIILQIVPTPTAFLSLRLVRITYSASSHCALATPASTTITSSFSLTSFNSTTTQLLPPTNSH
jgi:hypothetical protein